MAGHKYGGKSAKGLSDLGSGLDTQQQKKKLPKCLDQLQIYVYVPFTF